MKARTSETITISVTGIRGKSSFVRWLELILRERGYKVLAKVTGDEPYWIVKGQREDIDRKGLPVLIDIENQRIRYIGSKKLDFLILENQAITPYTMRVFHDIVKPDVAVVVNIRLDHTDTLGETREKIAQVMGESINAGASIKIVINGEENPRLSEMLKRACGHKIKFVQSKSENLKRAWTPLNMLIGLVDTTLKEITESGLGPEEAEKLFGMTQEALQIRHNGSIAWYDGAKLNDIDSTGQVIDFLIGKYPDQQFTIVAYLRKDRAARSETFVPFFKKLSETAYVKQIILAGYGAEFIAKKIGDKAMIVKENSPPGEIISFCGDSVLFTACNGVNQFRQQLKKFLEEKEANNK